jgi:hypothetical protein
MPYLIVIKLACTHQQQNRPAQAAAATTVVHFLIDFTRVRRLPCLKPLFFKSKKIK